MANVSWSAMLRTRKILQAAMVAGSMVIEIGQGAGENGDHVLLKLDHLGEDILHSRPGYELSKTFAHVDPVKEPIPVVPTCHYMMGGLP